LRAYREKKFSYEINQNKSETFFFLREQIIFYKIKNGESSEINLKKITK